MPHFQARPKHLFSWGFELFVDAEFLTTLDVRCLHDGGAFSWDDTPYRLGREGFRSGDFFLEANGEIAARATKPNPFLRRFVIRLPSRDMEFSAASPFVRAFQLTEQGSIIGCIRPHHPFTRKCAVDLPEDLSIPERVFIFWLAVLMWRRTSRTHN
jgi:hypothetical protein